MYKKIEKSGSYWTANVSYRRKIRKIIPNTESILFTQIHGSGIYFLVSVRSLQIYCFITMFFYNYETYVLCVFFLNDSELEG